MQGVAAVTPLAAFASQEYVRRKSLALRKLTAGEWDAETYHHRLAPFLAAACMVGADLPELVETVDVIYPYPRGKAPSRSSSAAVAQRRILPDEICPPAEMRAMINLAKVGAIDSHHRNPSPERAAYARNLIALASALGAGPYEIRKQPPSSTAGIGQKRIAA